MRYSDDLKYCLVCCGGAVLSIVPRPFFSKPDEWLLICGAEKSAK